MKKIGILIAMLIFLPFAIATDFEISINDEQGDVSNPDIDILKAWTTQEGNYLVFHVKVAGNINNACSYTFTATNGIVEIGAVYSNGIAYYSGSSSGGQAEYSIDGDTCLLYTSPSPRD